MNVVGGDSYLRRPVIRDFGPGTERITLSFPVTSRRLLLATRDPTLKGGKNTLRPTL